MSDVHRCLRPVLLMIMLLAFPGGLFASGDLDVPIEHGECAGNLAEELRFIAEQYRVPVIAELAYPVPGQLAIEAGKDTAIGLLGKLLAQAPTYSYEVVGGHIVHFYEKDTVGNIANILNTRMKHFTMPGNLSDFKLLLPAAINSARKGLPAGGFVISGFPSRDMEKEKLQPSELTDISGRDLLLAVARESPSFFTILVMPSKKCKSEACYDYVSQHWTWGPLNGVISNSPIYIQSPPQE